MTTPDEAQALLPVTPETEAYCLGLLTEEAGEVLQLVGKALRFGIDTPGVKRLDGTIDYALTSRSMLPVELGDFLAGIDFAIAHGLIDAAALAEQRRRKFAKLTDPTVMDNLGRPLAPQPARISHSLPGDVGTAAINQNDAMRQDLAHVGNLISDLARAMGVDQANDDGSWPDLAGRIEKLTRAALTPSAPDPKHPEIGTGLPPLSATPSALSGDAGEGE